MTVVRDEWARPVGLLLILAALCVNYGFAVEGKRCSNPEAHAFDFWIGDWDIQQKILRQDGTWLELPAHTSVSAALEGCALVEHWRGQVQFFWEGMEKPEAIEGLSVRAYDPKTAKWYIHWMDTRSPRFRDPYVGTFEQRKGEFFREWVSAQGRRVGRILFSDVTPNAVTWSLAVSNDQRATWRTLWIMEMKRAPGRGDSN